MEEKVGLMHTIIKIAVASVLALFAIVGVVSISKAEVLNLELECAGEFEVFSLDSVTDERTYDISETVQHTIRFSIVDDALIFQFGNYPLEVYDKLITISPSYLKTIENKAKNEDGDFAFLKSFSLDRLTGKVKFEARINDPSNPISNETGYTGLQFEAGCKKLDPTKKLF